MQAAKRILEMIEKGEEDKTLQEIKKEYHIETNKAAKSVMQAFELTPENVEKKIKKEIKKLSSKMEKEQRKYNHAIASYTFKDTNSILKKHSEYKRAIGELENLL